MKIIIATGGSGGHIFPALKVARRLKSEGTTLLFVGSFGPWLKRVESQGFEVEELCVQGFVFNSLKSLWSVPSCLIKSFFDSLKILKSFQPDVVLGFGGYGAFPLVFAAALRRHPTLIHEQNVIPGRANAILAKFVRKIAISFPNSQKYFQLSKTILTGCPCHSDDTPIDRKDLLGKFDLEDNRYTILILGGSQGSHRINEAAIKAIKETKEDINLQAIHVCGPKDYASVKEKYQSLGIPFCVYEFLDEITQAYKVADLIISRSGALTIAEIIMAHKPAILIPYPYAGGHQKANAQVLGDLEAAKVIEEKDLTLENLKEAIQESLTNQLSEEEFKNRVRDVSFPDAEKRLVEETSLLVK